MAAPIQWVFLDIGGPILDEQLLQEHWGRTFREAAGAEGVACGEELYESLTREGIQAFAGSVTDYVAWRLAEGDPDLYGRIHTGFWGRMQAISEGSYRELNPLQEGTVQAVEDLSRQFRLGVVANQPARVEGLLREYRLWDRFEVHSVSDVVGLFKPDVRLYERTLQEAGALPEESVMVGDRIDNDIVPARTLGMWTIQLQVGRHARQRPRSPGEVPHRTIPCMDELPRAVRSLSSEKGPQTE